MTRPSSRGADFSVWQGQFVCRQCGWLENNLPLTSIYQRLDAKNNPRRSAVNTEIQAQRTLGNYVHSNNDVVPRSFRHWEACEGYPI